MKIRRLQRPQGSFGAASNSPKAVLLKDDSRSSVAEFRAHGRQLLGAAIGIGCGIGFYTPVSSLFLHALEEQFHWTKSQSALSFIALPASAIILPAVGWLVDRVGVRRVAFLSSLLYALSLLGLSFLTGRLSQFYLTVLAVVALGAGTGPVAYTRVVAAFFHKSRGFALAVSLLGTALVGAALPPLVSHIISSTGWRAAYRILAFVALLGGGLAAYLVGGGVLHRSGNGTVQSDGATLPAALRTVTFWFLAAALLFITSASLGFTSQLQSIGIERGLSPSLSAWLISTLSLSIVVSRLVIGRALDVMDPRLASAGTLALASIGALLVAAAPIGGAMWVFSGVVLLGCSIGAELDVMSFFCARYFGMRAFSTVYGALSVFFYIGIAAGSLGYGFAHDHTGAYTVALAISAGLLATSAALLRLLPREGVYR